MKKIIAGVTLFLFSTPLYAVAFNDNYLQALELAKAGNYGEAAALFKQQEVFYQDEPTYLYRSKAWRALTLLAENFESAQAEAALLPMVCGALTEADFAALEGTGLQKECANAKGISSTPATQFDKDIATASMTVLGSLRWRDNDYLTALKLLTLSSHRANELANGTTNTDFLLNELQQQDASSNNQQPDNAQMIQNLLMQRMQEKALARGENLTRENAIDQETLQMLAQAKMAEAMAKVQQQQAAVLDAMSNDSLPSAAADLQAANEMTREEQREQKKAQRQRAKLVSKEPDYYYSLAGKTVCQYMNAPNIQSVSDAEKHTRTALAGHFEAGRGQLLESYKMAGGEVLQALNDFLDINEPLRARSNKFDMANRQRNRFLETLAFCADTMNLETNFNQAFLTLMTRNMVNGLGEKQVLSLIATQKRLADSGKFSDPMADKQEYMRNLALGEFYLRTQKPEQALPELRKAFDGFGPDPHMSQFAEYAHFNLMQSAKILQGIHKALEQTSGDIDEVKAKQKVLQSRVRELQVQLASEANEPMTTDVNLTTAKSEINKAFNSPKNQDAMAQLQKLSASMAGENENNNPFEKLSTIMNQLNSGEMDGDMAAHLEQIQEKIIAQAPVQLEDLMGTTLEREFYRHNHYLLLQLIIAQLSLDMLELKTAEEQLQTVESYLQKHPGWINSRIEAYRQYTWARLFTEKSMLNKAETAYLAAVEGWYFSPHSMLDIVLSPLKDNTEILSQAVDLALRQNQIELAFGYSELMREVNWNNENAYGAYNKAELDTENAELQKQFEALVAKAQATASASGERNTFDTAREMGINQATKSQRADLSKALILLTELEPLLPWAEPNATGAFVARVIRQANREQATRFQVERKEYLAKEMGVKLNVNANVAGLDAKSLLTLASTLKANTPEDTLLLSIWMGRDTSFVFALDNKQIRAHKVASAKLTQEIIQFNRRRLFDAQYGNSLYEQLVAPYLHNKVKKLVVVSNGALQNAPFAAFSTDPDSTQWLGEKYLIRSLPSARQLLTKMEPNPLPLKVLVLDGSDVPNQLLLENAESEIASLFTYFKGQHIRPEALHKENIIPMLNQYSLVHFAGHSVLNGDIPDYSSMKLYEDDLYLAELQQLNLSNIDLMVLGSCESAAARETWYGDEFSSLQQSLHDAGVKSVLATLYKVDDELSSVLISHFYERLSKGDSKDKALQAAQKAARDYADENMEHEENHNWAAFVLSGSPRPL